MDWEGWKKYYLGLEVQSTHRMIDEIDQMDLTPIEKITMMFLLQLYPVFGEVNVDGDTQKQIGEYRVDFELNILHAGKAFNFIIECDGHDFHEKTKEQAARDKKRDRYFTKLGYTVLRYTGSEIVKKPDAVVWDIREIILPKRRTGTDE